MYSFDQLAYKVDQGDDLDCIESRAKVPLEQVLHGYLRPRDRYHTGKRPVEEDDRPDTLQRELSSIHVTVNNNVKNTAIANIHLQIQNHAGGLASQTTLLREDAEDNGALESTLTEMRRVEAAAADLANAQDKNALETKRTHFDRIRSFLDKLGDATSVGKLIQQLEDGTGHAAKLIGFYNKLAPFAGLPPAPNPFGKKSGAGSGAMDD